MSGQLLKQNGVIRQLGAGEKPVNVEMHISGAIQLSVGRETVLLPPRLAAEMAVSILRGLGIGLEKSAVETLLAMAPKAVANA